MDGRKLIRRMKEMGVDTDTAVARFMGNEVLYLSFIPKLLRSMDFSILKERLQEKDEDGFYEAVHGLKGTSGSLGANGIFTASEKILKELREHGLAHLAQISQMIQEMEQESRPLYELLELYTGDH